MKFWRRLNKIERAYWKIHLVFLTVGTPIILAAAYFEILPYFALGVFSLAYFIQIGVYLTLRKEHFK